MGTIKFDGKTTTFFYDNDTGMVLIQGGFEPEIQVDVQDLISFISEVIVRPKLIEVIKNAEPIDLLLGQFNPLPLIE
jgi:hypothetical protein